MADGKGDSDGNCNDWRQREWDSGSDGRQWLQQQWPTATAIAIGSAIGNGNINSNGDGDSECNGDSDGDCNGDGNGTGNNDKGRAASSCARNVQHCGRGHTLPPPPWTQRKVHSPALCHGGDTAKSVCLLSRERVPDSSPWIVFLFIFYNYSLFYWTPLCSSPALFRCSRTLLAHWYSTSFTPPRSPSAYCWSTSATIALICQGKPRQGLQWL